MTPGILQATGGVLKERGVTVDIIDLLHIKRYCKCGFRFQDLYPYDAFILGIENLYYTVDDYGFFINSKCICTPNHIVAIGKDYVLKDNFSRAIIELQDVYYRDGIVHIIVRDILKKCIKVVKCTIPEGKDFPCTWRILDVDYMTFNQSSKINDYPTNTSGCTLNSDLLEFDF